jgi:acetate kinase
LDPGIVLHLLDLGYSAGDLDRMLNHESGLLGVSGITADMKVLLSRRSTDVRAALAIEMFCYQARKSIGAFTAALGGLDSLVFTGGIGEHAPAIRDEIVRGLGAFGIALDPGRNERAEPIISEEGSPCTVRVIATNEQITIARHVRRALFAC